MRLLTNIQRNRLTICSRYSIALLFMIVCCFIASTASAAVYAHEIQVDFSFDPLAIPGKTVTGYRLYKENVLVCETGPVEPQSITCADSGQEGTYAFTLLAVYNDGSKSPVSAPFPFTITTDPPPPPPSTGSTALFTWEYTTGGTTITGFKIYHNDKLVCETADSSLRQLACSIVLTETNVFRVTAVESGTTESTVSNSIVYTKDVAAPDPGTLAAVITTSSQNGAAPFSLTFDGSTSTGSISNYTWSFGDGQTAMGSTVTHIYQLPGAYTATLTVADLGGLTQQNSIIITVSPIVTPPPTTPPTVVISSSSAVGVAPFTVQFDGSGSTSAQPPLVSYAWDFADGASGDGAVVAHTYTVAGTYHPTLTVTDSVGLTSQTSTPVLISEPPIPQNQEPIASFTATPTTGITPLTVSFNASGSSDPDGSISGYVWSFGDGSTASGVSVQHTFTVVADYTASLQVTDDKGASAVSAQAISVVNFDFELGEVQVGHNWKTVAFKKPFINPIVIAGPPSFAGAAPATTRVRNVTPKGFEIRIQEWKYEDGKHLPETFSYIAMEKGMYTLADGAKVEAGSFTGSTAFQTVSLQQANDIVPVILAQVMTENEVDAVTGRIGNRNLSSFQYKLQEQELTPAAHKPETIGYIAWKPGKGTYSGLLYEAGVTTKSVTDSWFTLTFKTKFPVLPLFVAGIQTYTEFDPAVLRAQGMSQIATQVKIEEEQSKDAETSHAAEVVGYLAISPTTAAVPSVSSGSK